MCGENSLTFTQSTLRDCKRRIEDTELTLSSKKSIQTSSSNNNSFIHNNQTTSSQPSTKNVLNQKR